MPSADEPKYQFVSVSNARLPPHSANPGAPRVRSTSSQFPNPLPLYPPPPPCPASLQPRFRPATYTTIVSAGITGLSITDCWPVAGLMKLALQVVPAPGMIADRCVPS